MPHPPLPRACQLGLDACVYIGTARLGLRIILATAWFDLGVVLPVNLAGNYVSADSATAASDLDRFTMAHVAPGSRLLWVHAASVIVKTAAVLALLERFSAWVHVQQLRARRAAQAAAAPAQRTVLVTHVPPGADVAAVFRAWYGDEVERVTPVVETRALQRLVAEKAALTAELAAARRRLDAAGAHAPRPARRVPRWWPCGEAVDTLDYCAERLLVCDSRLAAARRAVLAHPPEPALCRAAAFVTFRTPRAASVAGQVVHGVDAAAWRTAPAPEPGNVLWDNIGRYSSGGALAMQLASWAATLVFCGLYLVPAAAIQSFTFAASLARAFPPLRAALATPATQALVEGVLPSVLLFALAWLWPIFLRLFTVWQGAVTHADVDRGMTSKSFLFNVLIAFISTVLSGAVTAGLLEFVNDPAHIPQLLAVKIPATSRFFMTYAIIQGVGGNFGMLARWWPALQYAARARRFAAVRRGAASGNRDGGAGEPAAGEPSAAPADPTAPSAEETAVWPTFHQPFGRFFPRILLQIQLLVIFSTIAPLMQAVSLLFFLPAISAAKVKMLFHHEKDYEGYGRMWPLVRSCVVIILVVYQLTMSGLLGLKGAIYPSWVAGTACIPATLLFGRRMAARYNPSMYGAVPIEVHAELERRARRSAAREGAAREGAVVPRASESSAGGSAHDGGEASAPTLPDGLLPHWVGAHSAVRLQCVRRGTTDSVLEEAEAGSAHAGAPDAAPQLPPLPPLPPRPSTSHGMRALAPASPRLPYLHPALADVDEALADDAALSRRFGARALADVVLRGLVAAGSRTGVLALARRLRAVGSLYCGLLVDPMDLHDGEESAPPSAAPGSAAALEFEAALREPPSRRIPKWGSGSAEALAEARSADQ